jgi:hypothetical protein
MPPLDESLPDDTPVDELTAVVMGHPPTVLMTHALYRFFDEHHRYMSFFMFVSDLATRADHVRTTAAKALLKINGEYTEKGQSHKAILEKPSIVFSHLQTFGRLQSRNLLLSSVNNFLCYFSETIQAAMMRRPELLKSGSTMRVDEVLTFKRRSELIAYLVDRQVNDLSYGGLVRMEEYMRDRLGIEAFADDNSRSIMIIAIELRNIHTHNRGVINDLFLSRVKAKAGFDFVKGQEFNADWDELCKIMQNNIEVACRIDEALTNKFKIGRKKFRTWRREGKGDSGTRPHST